MNSPSSSLKIVAVIWIVALLMNTVFGTALLTSLFTDAQIIGKVALIGFVFASIFTLPMMAVLLICLKIFMRMKISGLKLFGLFFITGNVLTAISFFVFSCSTVSEFLPVLSLYVIAGVSGSLAMLVEREAILHLGPQNEQYLSTTDSGEKEK
jgi:hypothetical protein